MAIVCNISTPTPSAFGRHFGVFPSTTHFPSKCTFIHTQFPLTPVTPELRPWSSHYVNEKCRNQRELLDRSDDLVGAWCGLRSRRPRSCNVNFGHVHNLRRANAVGTGRSIDDPWRTNSVAQSSSVWRGLRNCCIFLYCPKILIVSVNE